MEHKNTATLDSARSKKKSKVAVLQLVQVDQKPTYLPNHLIIPSLHVRYIMVSKLDDQRRLLSFYHDTAKFISH